MDGPELRGLGALGLEFKVSSLGLEFGVRVWRYRVLRLRFRV